MKKTIKAQTQKLLKSKLRSNEYQIFYIGSDYNLLDTLRFEPDYIVSSDFNFYEVNQAKTCLNAI